MNAAKNKRPILFITGMSGAGISTVLKALEDCGYEVFDNFPLAHIEPLINEKGYKTNPIAFGLDTRTRGFKPKKVIQAAKEFGATLIYLTSSSEKLQQRFSETRRTHPLAKDRTVLDGIITERELLKPLSQSADDRIDSTELTLHDLKRTIQSNYSPTLKEEQIVVTSMSFGFKHGTPREADIIMDVRFLRNPHWDEKLRHLTGKNKKIAKYIQEDKDYSQFLANFKTMIEPLIPRYAHEGKHYLTIGFGCTGGKHRSVFLAETIGAWLSESGVNVQIKHRDLKE